MEQYEVYENAGGKSKGEVIAGLITWLYTLSLCAFHFRRIFDRNFWGDEAFTILLQRGSIREIIEGTAKDVHPPLYYLILKPFVLLLGEHGYVLHGVSFLAFMLMMIFAAAVLYREFGKGAAWIFITFSGLSPSAARFHVEVRMYSWGALFLILGAYELYRIFCGNRKKAYSLFFLFTMMASYTHYYCLVSSAFLYLSLILACILQKKTNEGVFPKRALPPTKTFLVCMAAVLGYLPWLPVVFRAMEQRKEEYWIQKIPSFDHCIRYLWGRAFSLPFLCFSGLAFMAEFLIMSGKILYIRRKDTVPPRIRPAGMQRMMPAAAFVCACILSGIGTITAGILVSVLYRPFFVLRYLYPVSTLSWLALGICVSGGWYMEGPGCISQEKGLTSHRRRLHGFRLILSFICAGYLACVFWPDCRKLEEKDRLQNEQLEKTLSVMEEVQAGDELLTNHGHFVWTIGKYYFPDNGICRIDLLKVPPLDKNLKYWLLVSELQSGWERQDAAVRQIKEQGFICEKLLKDGNLGTHPVHVYRIYAPGFRDKKREGRHGDEKNNNNRSGV